MLFLLAACDPGFSFDAAVTVHEDVAALYTEDDPGIVTIQVGESFARSFGMVCGPSADSWHYTGAGIGCGVAGTEAVAAIWPIDAFPADWFEGAACGVWDEEGPGDITGEPDFSVSDTFEEPVLFPERSCGGDALLELEIAE